MKYIWHGTMYRGHFVADKYEAFIKQCDLLNGERVDVTLEKHRKTRSNNQNRYFHAVIVPYCSDFTGYTLEETKDMLKIKFLKVHRDGLPPTIRGTSDLTTSEFEDFCSKIRQWMSIDFGVNIPDPNQVDFT